MRDVELQRLAGEGGVAVDRDGLVVEVDDPDGDVFMDRLMARLADRGWTV